MLPKLCAVRPLPVVLVVDGSAVPAGTTSALSPVVSWLIRPVAVTTTLDVVLGSNAVPDARGRVGSMLPPPPELEGGATVGISLPFAKAFRSLGSVPIVAVAMPRKGPSSSPITVALFVVFPSRSMPPPRTPNGFRMPNVG